MLFLLEIDSRIIGPVAGSDGNRDGDEAYVFERRGIIFALDRLGMGADVAVELIDEAVDAVARCTFEATTFVIHRLHGANQRLLAAGETDRKQEERKTKNKGNPPYATGGNRGGVIPCKSASYA